MRTITLNPKQQREVEILTRLEAGVLDAGTAAELLGVGVAEGVILRLPCRARHAPGKKLPMSCLAGPSRDPRGGESQRSISYWHFLKAG
jgi:hypothetical protein